MPDYSIRALTAQIAPLEYSRVCDMSKCWSEAEQPFQLGRMVSENSYFDLTTKCNKVL
jgi:hypothetical protein